MPDHRLIAAAGAESRLEAAQRWLEGTASCASEVLVLAPSRGAADEVLRRACPESGGLFGIHRATPMQLASELATPAMARAGLAPVAGLGLEALAARAISICRADDELSYFEPVADAPGMARALAATLNELRCCGAEPQALAATGEPGGDLRRLLAHYEGELERRSLLDEAGLFACAREQAKSASHALLELPILLLDLELPSRVERRFLAAVVARAPSAFATVVQGDDEGVHALEEMLGVAAELGGEAGVGSTPLERLRRRIFSSTPVEAMARGGAAEASTEGQDTPEVSPQEDRDGTFSFFSAAGEGRECVEIARRIHALVASGVSFDRIAILLRDPDSYLPLVEEALRRAGIPAYFSRGTVRPDPAGRAFLALLDCRSEDFSASRFAEYLSLGQVPPVDEEGAPPEVEVPWVSSEGDQLVFKTFMPQPVADALEASEEPPPKEEAEPEVEDAPVIAGTLRTPRGWERLLVDARVIGGLDRWRDRLRGLRAELELRIQGPLGEDRVHTRHLQAQIERLGHLEHFALPVIEALDELPTSAPWGEWLASLETLASRVLKTPEKVLMLLAELRPMDQVGPVTLDEVRRVLGRRLSFLRLEPSARPYGQVFVATIVEARGRSFEAVFLPGLSEGTFPRRALEDPLLLDVYRQQLDVELVTQKERVTHERLLLRLAAGAAKSRLVVSYPNLDVLEGRPRVPSFYALDLLRAAEGRIPDLRRLEARATAGSQSLLGWPAPRRSETAIDEAEFDLSVLEPLLRRGVERQGSGATSSGRGRFLLRNQNLDRSLRSRYLRWKRNSRFTPADGIVELDDDTLEALGRYRLDQRGYSPTALQRYAACPYRFLLYSVQGLKPRERAVRLEQLDPLTRGSLFHRIQFELFQELKARDLLAFEERDEAPILDLLADTVASVAGGYHEDLAPAIERVWQSEIESLHTDLRGWVRERIAAQENWLPAHFELNFGLAPTAPKEEPEEPSAAPTLFDEVDAASSNEKTVTGPLAEAQLEDGKRLRGAVDLVEIDPESGLLRVTDHKTGKSPMTSRLVVGGGKVLQPVLYGLAMERLLERPVALGRLLFCTRRGGHTSIEVPLDDSSRQAASEVLGEIDRAIESGFLPAAPGDGECRWCDYKLVCGPNEEARLRRKHPRRLVPLNQMRSLP